MCRNLDENSFLSMNSHLKYSSDWRLGRTLNTLSTVTASPKVSNLRLEDRKLLMCNAFQQNIQRPNIKLLNITPLLRRVIRSAARRNQSNVGEAGESARSSTGSNVAIDGIPSMSNEWLDAMPCKDVKCDI